MLIFLILQWCWLVTEGNIHGYGGELLTQIRLFAGSGENYRFFFAVLDLHANSELKMAGHASALIHIVKNPHMLTRENSSV